MICIVWVFLEGKPKGYVNRMENITILTPMIIWTHAQTNPTVTSRLWDEEYGIA